MSHFKGDNHGNSMVEMILFIPLGLLFLFLVTDAGIALHDRSGIIDAARAAILSHPKELPLLQAYDAELGFDAGEQEQFLAALAGNIESGVGRVRQTAANAQSPFIRVAIVRVKINSASGELESAAIDAPDAMLHQDQSSLCSDTSLEEFLKQKLSPERDQRPSSLAIPLAAGFVTGTERFSSDRYLIAAQICGRSRGISGNLSQAFLGRFFQFHEEQLLPLRVQPRPL